MEKQRGNIEGITSRSRNSSGAETTVGTEQEGKPIIEKLQEAQWGHSENYNNFFFNLT